MLLWATLLVVAATVVYVAVAYNNLVRMRQMANEAWSGLVGQRFRKRCIFFGGELERRACKRGARLV